VSVPGSYLDSIYPKVAGTLGVYPTTERPDNMSENLLQKGRYWGTPVKIYTGTSFTNDFAVYFEFDITHIWKGPPTQEEGGEYVVLGATHGVKVSYVFNGENNQRQFAKLDKLGLTRNVEDLKFSRSAQWQPEDGSAGGDEFDIYIYKGKQDGNQHQGCEFWCNSSGSKSQPTADQITDINAQWQQHQADNGATIPF
jgi:hypothetical protein